MSVRNPDTPTDFIPPSLGPLCISSHNMRVPRAHIIGPGMAFHKIWCAHNREPLLQSHKDKHAYLQALHDDYIKNCSREDFVINVYTLMSNHGHERNEIKYSLKAFSDHMRRAHGRFGLCYNKRHKRLGKVAHDRPKTIRLQDLQAQMACDLYILANPVRARLIKQPYDIQWKFYSTARYMGYGEKNNGHDHVAGVVPVVGGHAGEAAEEV